MNEAHIRERQDEDSTATGSKHLELPEEFRFEDADNWVRMVRTSRRGNQWWAGDLANALKSRFPDRYSQYDHTDFGYTPESLANAQRVCAEYEVWERWDKLTFGHTDRAWLASAKEWWVSVEYEDALVEMIPEFEAFKAQPTLPGMEDGS